jgi:hypothetical protein
MGAKKVERPEDKVKLTQKQGQQAAKTHTVKWTQQGPMAMPKIDPYSALP